LKIWLLFGLGLLVAGQDDSKCEKICEGVSQFQTCPCRTNELLRWVKSKGGFLGPISFRNGGFWADEDLPAGTLVANVPAHLILEAPALNLGLGAAASLAQLLADALVDANNPWHTYSKSLSHTCQLPFCGAAAPENVSLNYYFERDVLDVQRNLTSPSLWPQLSLAISRRWANKMIPLLDLFNHHETAGAPVRVNGAGDHYIQTKVDVKAGEQVFANYGKHSTMEWVQNYNMHHTSGGDTCTDALYLRSTLHTTADVYRCFKDDSSNTIDEVGAAIIDAMEQHNLAAVKGLAAWLDSHLILVP
jgi:hypothetical protein